MSLSEKMVAEYGYRRLAEWTCEGDRDRGTASVGSRVHQMRKDLVWACGGRTGVGLFETQSEETSVCIRARRDRNGILTGRLLCQRLEM